jgi:hypothetical protein
MTLLGIFAVRGYTWIVMMAIGIPVAVGYFILRWYLPKKVDMGTIEAEPPVGPPTHEAH